MKGEYHLAVTLESTSSALFHMWSQHCIISVCSSKMNIRQLCMYVFEIMKRHICIIIFLLWSLHLTIYNLCFLIRQMYSCTQHRRKSYIQCELNFNNSTIEYIITLDLVLRKCQSSKKLPSGPCRGSSTTGNCRLGAWQIETSFHTAAQINVHLFSPV